MNNIQYEKLSQHNFNKHSLDHFIRHQKVTECLRFKDGEWKLVKDEFTENWDLEKCREIAGNIAVHLNETLTGFGAFKDNELIGYLTIGKELFGSSRQYVELLEFEISEPYRRQGIGKTLFKEGCNEARTTGARKLYISAHSSKESQAAYRKLGCVPAVEPNPVNVEKEPCDVQMEYDLSKENML